MEKKLQEFVRYAEAQNLAIEGIAAADEKTIWFEHRFTPDVARNIYSHTKSYMATAVGMAVDEGKLSLTDRLVDFFPEKVPKNPDPRLEKIQLHHLMMMASGFNHAYLMNADRRAGVGLPDYVAYMMSQKVEEEPGTSFVYSSADSILAGHMVEKAVGMRLGEYLYNQLLSKLDIGWPMWEADPLGHPVGCGGMVLKLKDMMKLGQLYLADGVWNGERLISQEWIRKATSKQMDTIQNTDVWSCGYGYQFWMSPYPGAYRADGAYGQVTTVFPEKGIVVAVQCPEYGDFDKVKNALHTELFSRL